MAVPSAQDIQEHIRQQQLVGPSQQQPFSPLPSVGNYNPYLPQSPYPVPGMASHVNPKSIPVSVGKVSLLGISFSLMLLGAFTFLGGFFLGIWVARPSLTQPLTSYAQPSQDVSYPSAPVPYAQPSRNSLGEELGRAARATITSLPLHREPTALSPLIRATQEEIGRGLGHQTEAFVKKEIGGMYSQPPAQMAPYQVAPSSQMMPPSQGAPYPQMAPQPQGVPSLEPYSPQPSEPTQLPVITPQSGAMAPHALGAMPSDEAFTVQLGEYASLENANALMNHLQMLNYPSQVTQGKASDGGKLYYVHSGFYKDYTMALQAVSQFASQNIPGALVVKVSQQNKSVP
jgi:cell division septation protein DedD